MGIKRLNPETQVKNEIQNFLAQTGTFYMRMQSGIAKVRGGFMHLCPTGTADILAFPQGQVVWIETKTKAGKMSEAQKVFEEKVIAAGHHYLLARNLDDVANWMRESRG